MILMICTDWLQGFLLLAKTKTMYIVVYHIKYII